MTVITVTLTLGRSSGQFLSTEKHIHLQTQEFPEVGEQDPKDERMKGQSTSVIYDPV